MAQSGDGLAPLGTLLWIGREEQGQQDQKESGEQRFRAARSPGGCNNPTMLPDL